LYGDQPERQRDALTHVELQESHVKLLKQLLELDKSQDSNVFDLILHWLPFQYLSIGQSHIPIEEVTGQLQVTVVGYPLQIRPFDD
jgi:hypothetical protein